MAARLTIYSGWREWQAGIQFCTDGGNGGRVYNSLWVEEKFAGIDTPPPICVRLAGVYHSVCVKDSGGQVFNIFLYSEFFQPTACNVPPGAAAGSASTPAPVRSPLLLFADSSSLPRSLLRVAIIRARIVTAYRHCHYTTRSSAR
ncbi:hypothetical protein T02_9401 [Trichinella nativa]|uniref:Uncharacterized protein n=1 Tax=Trichinella nativa TaxID=6335 RepID=A0A0V1KKA1_9BILA|nr:hypothetical protein T02_9401 [Trichinella nativa]